MLFIKKNLLNTIFVLLLFSCNSSVDNDNSYSEDEYVENTYVCCNCGATLTQSMLEDGRALSYSSSKSKSGLVFACAKHDERSSYFEPGPDEEVSEYDGDIPFEDIPYECSNCTTANNYTDESGNIRCTDCGVLIVTAWDVQKHKSQN